VAKLKSHRVHGAWGAHDAGFLRPHGDQYRGEAAHFNLSLNRDDDAVAERSASGEDYGIRPGPFDFVSQGWGRLLIKNGQLGGESHKPRVLV
jgi:hypothetical protein